MSNINLLPEDLRRKENALKNGEDFNLDDIEFTEGEQLKRELEFKGNSPKVKKVGSWLKPKIKNNIDLNKKYNKISSTNFVSPIKKQVDRTLSSHTDRKKESLKDNKDNLDNILDSRENNKVMKKDFKNQKIEKKNNKKSKDKNHIFKGFFGKNKKQNKNEKDKKEDDLDVNLLPFGSNIPATRKMISAFIITFIISISLVFVVYFGYFIYKDRVIDDYGILKEELDSYLGEIKKYDDLMKETSAWEKKVVQIEELLNKHIYWTKFFEKLEENTLPEVKFIGFAGTTDNTITLEAVAPNYGTVSRQWIKLKNAKDFIENIEVGEAQMITSNDSNIDISFSLILDFVDDIFYYNE